MVSDEVIVLRMVWHPFDFGNEGKGELLSTAFGSNDLLAQPDDSGYPRYMSADDRALISKASVDWRINWQQRDGRDIQHKRHRPRFVQFETGRLRNCRCSEDRQLFNVTREPMSAGEDGVGSPENPAHCGVRTLESERYAGLTKPEKKLALNRLRTQVMNAIGAVLEYEQVFPDLAP